MRISKVVLLAVCVVGTANITTAGEATPENPGAKMHHGRMHAMHHRAEPPLARVIQRLDLTDAQRESLRSLIESTKAEREALHARQRDATLASMSMLPDDPNYPALIETRKELASTAIQQRSDLNVQIYALLTPEQKARMPQLIEEMKAEAKERRGKRWQKRSDTQL